MNILCCFAASIALLTGKKFDEWKFDDKLLIDALKAEQIEAKSVVWDNPNNDWSAFDAVIVFSTWDYCEGDNLADFLETIHSIEKKGVPVYNNFDTIKWNSSKKYLNELAKKGVPIIESAYITAADLENLPNILLEKEWNSYIIKPVVGCGGHNTLRFNRSTINKIQEHFKNFERELIVQPFMQEIITEGEWSFVFFDNEFVHCVLNKPAQSNFLVQVINGGSVNPIVPPEWMIQEAKKILQMTGKEHLHARVDLIRKENSVVVMEIEMIEPWLYLCYFPGSEKKMAKKIKEYLTKNIHVNKHRIKLCDWASPH